MRKPDGPQLVCLHRKSCLWPWRLNALPLQFPMCLLTIFSLAVILSFDLLMLKSRQVHLCPQLHLTVKLVKTHKRFVRYVHKLLLYTWSAWKQAFVLVRSTMSSVSGYTGDISLSYADVSSELAVVSDGELAFTDSLFSTADARSFIKFLCTVWSLMFFLFLFFFCTSSSRSHVLYTSH